MNSVVNERVMSVANERSRRLDVITGRAKDLLNLRRLPSRLGVIDAAILLNIGEHDVPVLIKVGLLKPLGNPPANAIKYFCTADLLDYAADRKWLSQMCDAIYQHWRKKNSKEAVPDL